VKSTITLEQFYELTESLVGLPITKTNEGYFHTGLFHLGELTKKNFKNGKSVLEGAASIMFEWGWRVEKSHSVVFSSSSETTKKTKGLAKLEGKVVEGITVEGRLPDLSVRLSSNTGLRSLSFTEGQLRWFIFLPNKTVLSSRSGKLQVEKDDASHLFISSVNTERLLNAVERSRASRVRKNL
jgi:hypothetical protein